jgi:hypothetical protein
VGVAVLVLRELDGLEEGLTEIREGGSVFGFDFALSGVGKDFGEGE